MHNMHNMHNMRPVQYQQQQHPHEMQETCCSRQAAASSCSWQQWQANCEKAIDENENDTNDDTMSTVSAASAASGLPPHLAHHGWPTPVPVPPVHPLPLPVIPGGRYTATGLLGRGSYGAVYSAVDQEDGRTVAIKHIRDALRDAGDAVRVLREIKLLRVLRHEDVVRAPTVLLPDDPEGFIDVFIVFDHMESDLGTVIRANCETLSPAHHRVLLYQLLRGIAFIHGCGVVHRDLKPQNILVNGNCKLKICDLGIARPYGEAHTPVKWTDYVATRWYRAPELIGRTNGRYTQAVDIWSVGCIFAEVILCAPLFPGRDAESQLRCIMELLGTPPPGLVERMADARLRAIMLERPARRQSAFRKRFTGVNADADALDLLRRMLEYDPDARITAADALAHPYFKIMPAVQARVPSSECSHVMGWLRELDEYDHILSAPMVRKLVFDEITQWHVVHDDAV